MSNDALIALAGIGTTLLVPMLAIWFRAGQILNRVDGHHESIQEHGKTLKDHGTRITRLEVKVEPNR